METRLLSFFQAELIEAGIDEAGRGCYAGPVFAAAVILPRDFFHPLPIDEAGLCAGCVARASRHDRDEV